MTDESADKTAGSPKSSASQGIRDLIERTFLAGMGAVAITKDRVEELVEEFISRGQLDKEEGRETVERLLARSREEARTIFKKADSSLQGAYRELGLTPKRELESLVARVDELTRRVALLESRDQGTVAGETEDGPTG